MDSSHEANKYEPSEEAQKKDGYALINSLELKKGEKVLDLGCGSGYLTKAIADHVGPDGKVLGIDPDESCIDIAKVKYKANNVEYQVAGSDNIPGDGYNLIYSNYVLHWIENKETFFKTAHKKLDKDGRLAFVSFSTITKEMVDKALAWADEDFKQDWLDCLYGVNKKDVKKLAQAYHFTIESLEKGSYYIEFKNADDYIELYLIYSGLDRSMFDGQAIKKYYGESKIVVDIPTTVAILKKDS